jgi:hypothetical protein
LTTYTLSLSRVKVISASISISSLRVRSRLYIIARSISLRSESDNSVP